MENAEDEFIQIDSISTRSLSVPTRRLMTVAMILSDILSILLAVFLATILRWVFLGPLLFPDSFLWVSAFLAIFVLSAALRDLYPAAGISSIEQLRHLTITTSLLTLVIISGTFFIKNSEVFSRLLIGLTWLISLVTIPVNRIIIRHLLSTANMWGEPVAIIGNSTQVEALTSYFSRYPKIGLKPEIRFTLRKKIGDLSTSQKDHLLENARKINKELDIHSVIVAYDEIGELASIREVIYEIFDHVLIANPENYGVELSGVKLRQYGKMHTFEIHHTLMDQFAQLQKRIIDVFIAISGLVILLPFLCVVTLFVAINSHGNVFYRQRRLGKYDKEFEIIKFRTMVPNADRVLQEYLKRNPERRVEWDLYQKLKNDPRITFVGRILRRFSIDELPQLWNVLVGDMSFVGPRPIMVNQRDLYGQNFRHYVRVRPGITGMWQISGRNLTSFATRVDYDVEYVMNWSIWLDIYIIIRTFWVVISQDGVS